MTPPPRRLPPTHEERVKVVIDRVAGGSDGGSTRFARPVPGLSAASSRSIPKLKGDGRFAPLGYGAFLQDPIPDNSLPVGTYATTEGAQAVAVGEGPTAHDSAVAVGYLAVAGNSITAGGVAVGFEPHATGDCAIAIGFNPVADDADAIAIGQDATVHAEAGIAIGKEASAQAYGLALGKGASANSDDAIAVGRDAYSANPGDLVLGTAVHTVVINTPVHTSAGAASGTYLPIRCGDGVIRLLPLYNLP